MTDHKDGDATPGSRLVQQKLLSGSVQEAKNAPSGAADETAEPGEPPQSSRQAKASGRGLLVLTFIFALTALAGVGYLFYALVYLQPIVAMERQSVELAADLREFRVQVQDQLNESAEHTRSVIAASTVEQTQQLAANEAAVIKSLNAALNGAPPSQRVWKLAEAEYLLRIANHRVLMEQDSAGALMLLEAADQIFAELDDFALFEVRASLSDEIVALRQVRRNDLKGLYLRLESLKAQVDTLPLPQPKYIQVQQSDGVTESVWTQLIEALQGFVRVRSVQSQEALQPFLAPQEGVYLQLNLYLALEQAQLAALKRQQSVFEHSLLNVRRWVVAHADSENAQIRLLLTELDELLLLELERPLPVISGSLNRLLSLSGVSQ